MVAQLREVSLYIIGQSAFMVWYGGGLTSNVEELVGVGWFHNIALRLALGLLLFGLALANAIHTRLDELLVLVIVGLDLEGDVRSRLSEQFAVAAAQAGIFPRAAHI